MTKGKVNVNRVLCAFRLSPETPKCLTKFAESLGLSKGKALDYLLRQAIIQDARKAKKKYVRSLPADPLLHTQRGAIKFISRGGFWVPPGAFILHPISLVAKMMWHARMVVKTTFPGFVSDPILAEDLQHNTLVALKYFRSTYINGIYPACAKLLRPHCQLPKHPPSGFREIRRHATLRAYREILAEFEERLPLWKQLIKEEIVKAQLALHP